MDFDEKHPYRSRQGGTCRYDPNTISETDLRKLVKEMEACGWEFRQYTIDGGTCFRCGGRVEPFGPAVRFMMRTWFCVACAMEHHLGRKSDLAPVLHERPGSEPL